MNRYSDETTVDVHDFLRNTHLSRRAALRAGLTLGATALGADLLAACANGSGGAAGGGGPAAPASPPAKAAAAPTARHQTVVIDQGPFNVYGSFNPLIPNGEEYDAGIDQVGREFLGYVNLATGSITHWQATGWQYNADFTQLTFALNPNVHWNDGEPFTSQDVKFTLDLYQKNQTLLPSLYAAGISSTQAPDPHTVVIQLKLADPRFHYHFLSMIIAPDFNAILPQHIWSKHDPTSFRNDPPVYTAPYKLNKSDRTLGMYIWEKDPKYWNQAQLNPAPRYVVYRSSPQADAENQDFKNAVVDVAQSPNVYSFTKQLIASGAKDVMITTMVDPCPRAIQVNSDASKGVLAEPKFRQAVSALLDREKIGSTVWTVKAPAATYPWAAYPSNEKWSNPAIASKYQSSYDPQRAAQLLDQAGATKGADGKRSYKGKAISLQIITPGQSTGTDAPEYLVAQLLAQELQKQGIDASAKLLNGPIFQDALQKGNYDLRSEWECGETLDPWQVYTHFSGQYYKPIGQTTPENYDDVRLKDSKFDDLVATLGKMSPDDPAAKPVFDQAMDEFFSQLPSIAYLQTVYTHQFNTTYWTGWPSDDNLYQPPNNWWPSFMFVIGRLQATGKQ